MIRFAGTQRDSRIAGERRSRIQTLYSFREAAGYALPTLKDAVDSGPAGPFENHGARATADSWAVKHKVKLNKKRRRRSAAVSILQPHVSAR
jgi:hypothetical protein